MILLHTDSVAFPVALDEKKKLSVSYFRTTFVHSKILPTHFLQQRFFFNFSETQKMFSEFFLKSEQILFK